MALITTIGAADANSYATSEEATAYLQSRSGFDASHWGSGEGALTDEQKEERLALAALLLDSLKFRGVKATKTQALAWPRLLPADPLYADDPVPADNSYVDWQTLVDFAELNSMSVPTIPLVVKQAQIEIAFQVVDQHLLTLEPFSSGDTGVNSVSIGGKISVSLTNSRSASSGLFKKAQMDALAVVKAKLAKFMSPFRGALI